MEVVQPSSTQSLEKSMKVVMRKKILGEVDSELSLQALRSVELTPVDSTCVLYQKSTRFLALKRMKLTPCYGSTS